MASPAHDERPALTKKVQRLLADNPELVALIPVLLERGDPDGRLFALNLAMQAQLPELDVALRDFALSRHGPDELRHRAALYARDIDLIGASTVQMWMQGEWREELLMSFEVTEQPYQNHSPEVEALLVDALNMSQAGDPESAIEILQQALALEPNAPDLLNNLAAAYSEKGEHERSNTLLFQIHHDHPDYLFAATSVARTYIRQSQFDAAESLLRPLMMRKRFHKAEFIAIMLAWIEFWVAQKKADVARSWLHVALQVAPDDPDLRFWQRGFEAPLL
jgi:tetratricopeptide (TPR) repeat protein